MGAELLIVLVNFVEFFAAGCVVRVEEGMQVGTEVVYEPAFLLKGIGKILTVKFGL